MDLIFKALGDVLGYMLLFFLEITKNYGISIILFTIAIKLIMVPMDIKRQKSMTKNAKFSKKQNELKKRYGNDKVKFNQELNKLYEKEGISPLDGCLPMVLPLFIILGVFAAVSTPLTSTFHFPKETVNSAIEVIKSNPDINALSNSNYPQIEIFSAYTQRQEAFPMFSKEQSDMLLKYSGSFNFLGMDLFKTPKSSEFSSMLWLIPALCFITSVFSAILLQKIQKASQPQATGGCINLFSFSTAFISAWFAYNAPVAVGLYWIVSTIFGIVQSMMFNKLYSIEMINVKEEAARIALRLQEEEKIQSKEV